MENISFSYLLESNYNTCNECADMMSQKLIIGSLNGNIILSMKNSINEIYPKAFDKQFIEPKVINHNVFCDDDKIIKTFNQNSDPLVNETNALRSSDYRCPQAQIISTNEIDSKSYAYDQNMRKRFNGCIERFGNSIEWFVYIDILKIQYSFFIS